MRSLIEARGLGEGGSLVSSQEILTCELRPVTHSSKLWETYFGVFKHFISLVSFSN